MIYANMNYGSKPVDKHVETILEMRHYVYGNTERSKEFVEAIDELLIRSHAVCCRESIGKTDADAKFCKFCGRNLTARTRSADENENHYHEDKEPLKVHNPWRTDKPLVGQMQVVDPEKYGNLPPGSIIYVDAENKPTRF